MVPEIELNTLSCCKKQLKEVCVGRASDHKKPKLNCRECVRLMLKGSQSQPLFHLEDDVCPFVQILTVTSVKVGSTNAFTSCIRKQGKKVAYIG